MKVRRRELIHIVDDDPSHRAILERILKGEGFDLRTSVDGDEFVGCLDDRVSAVLLDLRMPGKSGMECLRYAITNFPLLPVIVVSGAGVEDAVLAMQEGAFSFLQKPIAREQLLATIQRALEYRGVVRQHSDFERLLQGASSRFPFLGRSEVNAQFQQELKAAAKQDTILCVSERGTGTQEIARFIHQHSKYSSGPFLSFSPGSNMPEKIEAELFGVATRTGSASEAFPGLFGLAEGGTLFLDDLHLLPERTQGRFLTVVSERMVRRVGEKEGRKVPMQLICRVARPLAFYLRQELLSREFAEALTETVTVPSLRERSLDLPFLIEEYIEMMRLDGWEGLIVTDQAKEILCTYDWPGNVREFLDCLDRALHSAGSVPTSGVVIELEHIQLTPHYWREGVALAVDTSKSLSEIEKEVIRHVVAECEGNRTRAAERLGVSVKTIYNKLKEG
jgi:DNA-binding NtrC family response regulator